MNRRKFLKSIAATATGLSLGRFNLQPENDEAVSRPTNDSIESPEQYKVTLSNGCVRACVESLRRMAEKANECARGFDKLADATNKTLRSWDTLARSWVSPNIRPVLGCISDPSVSIVASVTDEKPCGGYILPGVDKEYVAKLMAVSQSLTRKGNK